MGDEFSCVSKGLDLSAPGPSGLANTMRFFADGDSGRVSLLKLYLNVNVAPQASGAQKRMAELGEELTRAALQASLPADAQKAISSGKPGKWTVAGAKVLLEKDVWPTGKGFSLKFTIELMDELRSPAGVGVR